MSIDFERELRAKMEHAPIRPRPDVVRTAYRRSRKRAVATRTAILAGTAVVAAVAVAVAITVPGGPQHGRSSSGQGSESNAYLVSRVTSAVAATSKEIMYTHAVFPTSGAVTGTIQDQWDYGSDDRWVAYSITGQLQWQDGNGYVHGKLDEINLNYGQRTYTTGDPMNGQQEPSSVGTSGQPNCAQVQSRGINLAVPSMGATAAQVASDMHAVLSCLKLTITWNQYINGTKAIKIVSHTPVGGLANSGRTQTEILWINQATFLPIEETNLAIPPQAGVVPQCPKGQPACGLHAPGGSGSRPLQEPGQPTTTVQYAWLPATKANLALLLVAIPPGFTQAAS